MNSLLEEMKNLDVSKDDLSANKPEFWSWQNITFIVVSILVVLAIIYVIFSKLILKIFGLKLRSLCVGVLAKDNSDVATPVVLPPGVKQEVKEETPAIRDDAPPVLTTASQSLRQPLPTIESTLNKMFPQIENNVVSPGQSEIVFFEII